MSDRAAPYIAVIIPLYNKSNYILRAIDSVNKQTFKNFEIIVVDDGSTDNGPILVQEVCNERIRLIRQKNSGVSAARNAGVLNTVAPYIAFLDADDVWLPNFLHNIVELIAKFPDAGLYATSYYYDDGSKKRVVRCYGLDPINKFQLLNNYFESVYKGELLVCSSAVCIPRYIFSQKGIWFPVSEKFGEDQYVWARIALEHLIAYASIPSAIYEICLSSGTHKEIKRLAVPHSIILSLSNFRGLAIDNKLAVYLDKYIAKHVISFVKINCTEGHKVAAIRLAISQNLTMIDFLRLIPYFLVPTFLVTRIKSLLKGLFW